LKVDIRARWLQTNVSSGQQLLWHLRIVDQEANARLLLL